MARDACLWKLTGADLDKLQACGEVRHYAIGSVIVNKATGSTNCASCAPATCVSADPTRRTGWPSFPGGASATLIADGDVELFAAPSAGIDALIEADPSFAGRLYLSLFVELARKLRATNQPVLPTDR
ncbi:MAG: hypothetical protein VW405_15175 [Rhodospirillaceae bacterium]